MKMKEKAIYILLLLMAMTLGAKAQNTISVAHLTGGQGKDVMIPISMDNNEDVVALQFDLQLPFAKTSGKQPTLTNRNTNGHTVSVRGMGSNRYRVVIVNMSNKPIAGSGGVLLNFPMTVPTGLDPESVHAITLSDVVITNRNGDNIQTGSTNGSYTIQRAPSPDLEVMEGEQRGQCRHAQRMDREGLPRQHRDRGGCIHWQCVLQQHHAAGRTHRAQRRVCALTDGGCRR